MSGARQPVDQDENLEAGAAGAASDIEARARRMGWTGKEEFKGDPARWMPAEDFVARGDELMPIMRSRLLKQDRVLEATERKLTEVTGLMEQMRTAAQKAEERMYQKARAEIEAERAAAVQSADTVGFQAAEARIKALDTDHAAAKPPPPRTTPTPDQPAPEIIEWVGRQPWWNKNQEATHMAVTLQAQIAQRNPHMALNDNLAEVERRIRGAYPEEFPADRRAAPAAVSGSTNGVGIRKPGKLTFDSLPADERVAAKKAFEKFKKQMPTYTEQEYLENYDWNG